MIVPTYSPEKIVNEDGVPTDGFSLLLRQLLQGLQLSISEDGYLCPSVSSEPGSSETPPDLSQPSQLTVLQNTFQSNFVNVNTQTVITGVRPGTVIFDPYEVNGATPPARNGQLKVLLNNGTFHAIVNL